MERMDQYILPKVKVEVSGRSMSEPVSEVALDSMIDQVYPKAPFAEILSSWYVPFFLNAPFLKRYPAA